MLKSATLSPCKRYRYDLWRQWDTTKAHLLVVGLNPSTADATLDDPTIRRCIGFARLWGFGGLCMANLFAYRDTDPKRMKLAPEPVGPENDAILTDIASTAGMMLAAWGVHGSHNDRDQAVLALLREQGDPVYCLGTTKCGQPRHPLFMPKSTSVSLFAG